MRDLTAQEVEAVSGGTGIDVDLGVNLDLSGLNIDLSGLQDGLNNLIDAVDGINVTLP